MAIPFKSPTPKHKFFASKEIAALDKLFTAHKVPTSRTGRLLLATWNVANLGAQGRTEGALRVIAHVLKRFDLVAVQEVNDRFKTFQKIVKLMAGGFDYIMTDTAGNAERLAFVYRTSKVTPTNLFGEMALRPRQYPKRTVKVRWKDKGVPRVDTFKNHRFVPFDRNPYIGSFQSGKTDFVLANVHLYFGKFQNSKTRAEREKYARRVLEIFTLAKWASGKLKQRTTYDKDIVLLGDMNVPSMDPNDSAYKALVDLGWQPVKYVSKTGGSNLGNDKTYDQMMFAPGSIGNRIKNFGIFDFDNAVFKPLWKKLELSLSRSKAISKFNAHVKHHFSDHRPLWVELHTK